MLKLAILAGLGLSLIHAAFPALNPQVAKDWMTSKRELVLGMFTHTAHHRGQAEVYLRANGIKPPAYRF